MGSSWQRQPKKSRRGARQNRWTKEARNEHEERMQFDHIDERDAKQLRTWIAVSPQPLSRDWWLAVALRLCLPAACRPAPRLSLVRLVCFPCLSCVFVLAFLCPGSPLSPRRCCCCSTSDCVCLSAARRVARRAEDGEKRRGEESSRSSDSMLRETSEQRGRTRGGQGVAAAHSAAGGEAGGLSPRAPLSFSVVVAWPRAHLSSLSLSFRLACPASSVRPPLGTPAPLAAQSLAVHSHCRCCAPLSARFPRASLHWSSLQRSSHK